MPSARAGVPCAKYTPKYMRMPRGNPSPFQKWGFVPALYLDNLFGLPGVAWLLRTKCARRDRPRGGAVLCSRYGHQRARSWIG